MSLDFQTKYAFAFEDSDEDDPLTSFNPSPSLNQSSLNQASSL
jgi:hypothetical protein